MYITCILPVLVEPKLNPVAGAAAVVVAAPKPGAVRATKKRWTQNRQSGRLGHS